MVWRTVVDNLYISSKFKIYILQRLPTTVCLTILVFLHYNPPSPVEPACMQAATAAKQDARLAEITKNGFGWFFNNVFFWGIYVYIKIYLYKLMMARAPSKGLVSKTSVSALMKNRISLCFYSNGGDRVHGETALLFCKCPSDVLLVIKGICIFCCQPECKKNTQPTKGSVS